MMCVMDGDGNVMAEAINFRVKRAGKELLAASLKEDLSHFYHNLDWAAQSLEGVPASDEVTSWIVLGDAAAAPELASKLQGMGSSVLMVTPGATFAVNGMSTTVRPDVGDDFNKLLEHAAATMPECTGVVHMWSLENSVVADPTPEQLEQASKVGTHSALLLCQAIATWTA
eukprot:COSAG05_NODE_7024_length_865_cov_0.977807_2_plen_170_part_01